MGPTRKAISIRRVQYSRSIEIVGIGRAFEERIKLPSHPVPTTCQPYPESQTNSLGELQDRNHPRISLHPFCLSNPSCHRRHSSSFAAKRSFIHDNETFVAKSEWGLTEASCDHLVIRKPRVDVIGDHPDLFSALIFSSNSECPKRFPPSGSSSLSAKVQRPIILNPQQV